MKAIGLMSGTSMDGVDVALIDTDGEAIASFGPTAVYPYELPERQLLREAMEWARGLVHREDRSGVLSLAEEMITARHSRCVKEFATAHGLDLAGIDIVGFHGQTVAHKPDQGFTVQLGDGRALSKALGVPVVFDFRAADMENGGQGAPLVPIFHRALAFHADLPLPAAFVNIGGIANVTFVAEGPPESLIAFDAGPGNCLIDDWALRHTGEPIDKDARLALSGTVNRGALSALISHPYFSVPPPKSLDRNSFTLEPVEGLSAADGAATLTAFTVAGIGTAARLFPETPKIWIVTGGGAHNPHILEGLRRIFEPPLVAPEEIGLNADFIEAQAFAYLAARHVQNLPSSFAGTTGARAPTVAGRLANGKSAKQTASVA